MIPLWVMDNAPNVDLLKTSPGMWYGIAQRDFAGHARPLFNGRHMTATDRSGSGVRSSRRLASRKSNFRNWRPGHRDDASYVESRHNPNHCASITNTVMAESADCSVIAATPGSDISRMTPSYLMLRRGISVRTDPGLGV